MANCSGSRLEMNNIKKEKENFENEKRDRKEMELHETDAMKILEHVTEKGISINQYKNRNWKPSCYDMASRNQSRGILLKIIIIGRILKTITSSHWRTRSRCKRMRNKILLLRSRKTQIEYTALGRHKKTQVRQFESSFDTMSHQEQEDWLKKPNLMKREILVVE